MKTKLLLIFALFSFGFAVDANAQACTADPNCTSSGGRICPDTIVNLPHATVGAAYSTTITVVVPTDTTVTQPFPLTATIGDFTLDSVGGMPAGFSYACNPSNCVFPGGSTGCLALTSANPGTAGTYPLVVYVTAHITAPLVIAQPSEITGYKIVIDGTVGVEVINENAFELAQNIPNPATGSTKIRFTTPVQSNMELNIYNSMGQLVINKKVDAEKGLNEVSIATAELADGIYIYTLNNGTTVLNRRMVVANK